jgi:hypothetical protein
MRDRAIIPGWEYFWTSQGRGQVQVVPLVLPLPKALVPLLLVAKM